MAALVGIAPNLGAVLASHVSLQFMDRRRLRTTHDVEGDGLVGVATEASDLKVSVTGVQGIADCRGRLGRSLVAEHPVVPGIAGEPIGHLARRLGAFGGGGDGAAVDSLA